MKEILCSKCGCLIGEIEKGKFMTVYYIECKFCMNKRTKSVEMPDFFKDIFGGKCG